MQPSQNQRGKWNAIAHEARLSGKDAIWEVAKAAYKEGSEAGILETLRSLANEN